MRYENKIKNNIDSEYNNIVADLKYLYNEIENLEDNELLRDNHFSDILCKMCVEITLRISKNSTFTDYLRKEGAMPMSWMTYEEEIQQAKREILTAKERGEQSGAFNMALKNIQNAMNNGNLPFDSVCELLGIKDKEKYQKFI